MKDLRRALFLIACISVTFAGAHQQQLIDIPSEEKPTEPWSKKYGDQYDLPYSGPLSFSRLPYALCLQDPSTHFDIAILGMPFDTAVSYRPGARFGPFAIRSGSRRQSEKEGYTLNWMMSPSKFGSIVDCGDVPVSGYDNALAVDQMETAYTTLLERPIVSNAGSRGARTGLLAKDGVDHPRIVTLGGDHTIVLPILRALHKVYGPISVIHFDAHIDTWKSLGKEFSKQSRVTHGTFFTLAYEEGLMANTSIHAGIRMKIEGPELIEHDAAVGFELIHADDMDELGPKEIIRMIRDRVGNNPVYLSFDIDTIDPGLAPATGTPEAGGWTTREAKTIIRGLAGLNFVGADLVEVAPAYDTAEITGIAAADLVHDFLSMLLSDKPPQRRQIREDL